MLQNFTFEKHLLRVAFSNVSVICVSKVKGVSVINVLMDDWVSQSYRCKVRPNFLSDISVNGKLYVSVISVQTVVQASHSYPPKRLISRLTHTGLDWIGLAHSYLNVLHNIKASLLAAFKYLKIPFSPGRPRHPPIYFIFYIFTSINHSFF